MLILSVFLMYRKKYLETRKKLNLEDKYHYPVLSSMDYGWGQTDIIKQSVSGQKRRGRVKIVEESFYRRNGIPFEHCQDML
ncbi:unnamed protein product [Echinostoma caproni]|uniref:Type I restriction-modification system, S subunit n=1 Tax=Echinostoma caproni TaxID=27848 RepID=A0A183B9I2_9TREM|nr:unnamed protein product [Echinostoma caproni]